MLEIEENQRENKLKSLLKWGELSGVENGFSRFAVSYRINENVKVVGNKFCINHFLDIQKFSAKKLRNRFFRF